MFDEINPIDSQTALFDLENGAFDNHWKKSTRVRVRASVRKAPKVFRVLDRLLPEDVPINRLEVDYAYARLKADRSLRERCGFKTQKALYTWWSTYGSFCDVVTGVRDRAKALKFRDDDWADLKNFFRSNEEDPDAPEQFDVIEIAALVRECRWYGLSIKALNEETVLDLVGKVDPNVMRAIIKGLLCLTAQHETGCLPEQLSPRVTSEEVKTWRFQTARRVPPLHRKFFDLAEEYITKCQTGRETVEFGSEKRTFDTKGIGKCRTKNLKVALRWLWHGLVILKLADEYEFDQSILSKPALLFDVATACSEGKLGICCSPITRRDNVLMVSSFLHWIYPGSTNQFEGKLWESNMLAKPEEKTKNEIFKQRTCLEFIGSRDFQREFYGQPSYFFKKAKPLIANFGSLGKAGSKRTSVQQHHALDLAIMAVLTTLMTRFPLRLNTISQLLLHGVEPHVVLPNDLQYEQGVFINITGDIMKNGRAASGQLLHDDNYAPGEILNWYDEEVHPLILKHKVKYKKDRLPNRLFGGLGTDFLRGVWNKGMSHLDRDYTPHMTRHLIASLLKSTGVSIDDIAELLCISPKVAASNYAFVDSNTNLKGVLNVQAKLIRHLEEVK